MAGKKGMRRAPVHERFWQFVVKVPDGCWQWTGSRLRDSRRVYGYGRIGSGAEILYAHRVSWEIHFGPVPEGSWVLHSCDNPECTRPDHLFLGDSGANVRDMWRKGRAGGYFKRAEFCGWGHPLSGDNLYLPTCGGRQCRACNRRRHANRKR